MLNFSNPNYRKSLFSFALVPFLIVSGGSGDLIYNVSTSGDNVSTSRENVSTSGDGQIVAQNTFAGWVASFWQRRPTKRLISRSSGISPIAPGLIDTYNVWSDRPLFMWHSPGINQDVQLIVRDLDNNLLWEQTVNLADQKAFYNAKNPLEPGKQYQWQLSGITDRRTFQVMPAGDRNKIQADLQALEQKLRATKASDEEIALRKADYFLNYPIKHKTDNDIHHLWSDALQAMFQVQQPSADFKKNREAYVADLFKSEDSTTEQVKK